MALVGLMADANRSTIQLRRCRSSSDCCVDSMNDLHPSSNSSSALLAYCTPPCTEECGALRLRNISFFT